MIGDTTGMVVYSAATLTDCDFVDDREALSVNLRSGAVAQLNDIQVSGSGSNSGSSNVPAIGVTMDSSSGLTLNGLAATNNPNTLLNVSGGKNLIVENSLITGTTVPSGSPVVISGVTNTTFQGDTLSNNVFTGGVATVFDTAGANSSLTVGYADFIGNVAKAGGGGFPSAGGLYVNEEATTATISLDEVNFEGNSANALAGALNFRIDTGAAPAALYNVDIVANQATAPLGGLATGGLDATIIGTPKPGEVEADVYNSILFANTGSSGVGDAVGAFASANVDIYTVGTTTGFTGVSSNLVGVNPDIAAYQVYLVNQSYPIAQLGSMPTVAGSPDDGSGSQQFVPQTSPYYNKPSIEGIQRPLNGGEMGSSELILPAGTATIPAPTPPAPPTPKSTPMLGAGSGSTSVAMIAAPVTTTSSSAITTSTEESHKKTKAVIRIKHPQFHLRSAVPRGPVTARQSRHDHPDLRLRHIGEKV